MNKESQKILGVRRGRDQFEFTTTYVVPITTKAVIERHCQIGCC